MKFWMNVRKMKVMSTRQKAEMRIKKNHKM